MSTEEEIFWEIGQPQISCSGLKNTSFFYAKNAFRWPESISFSSEKSEYGGFNIIPPQNTVDRIRGKRYGCSNMIRHAYGYKVLYLGQVSPPDSEYVPYS